MQTLDFQALTGRCAVNLTARLQLGICDQIVSRTLWLPCIVPLLQCSSELFSCLFLDAQVMTATIARLEKGCD